MFTSSYERAKRDAREAPPEDETEEACPHCGRGGDLPMDLEVELGAEEDAEEPKESPVPDKEAFVRALRKESR